MFPKKFLFLMIRLIHTSFRSESSKYIAVTIKCCCCCLLNFHTIRSHSDIIFVWFSTHFSQKNSQQPDCLSVVSGYQPTTQTNKQIRLIGTHWLTEQQHTKHQIWNQTMVWLKNVNGKDDFIIHPYLCGAGWCGDVWGGVGWWWSECGVEWCGGGVGMVREWSGIAM